MPTRPPASEAPAHLRATRELSAPPAPRESAAIVAAESPAVPVPGPTDQALPGASGESGQIATTATLSVFAVIAGIGWVVERRRRLARRVAAQPASTTEFEPANLPASQLQDFALPGSAIGAPAIRADKAVHLLGRPARKKLIKLFFWLRSVAGAAAILSAIAIAVFRAIEFTDPGAGDTGLNLPLLFLVLTGWLAYWGCGRLANQLHRSLFNRDHPRFAD